MTEKFDRKAHVKKHKERVKKERSERKSYKRKGEKIPVLIDPSVLRHKLVVLYNRLIREGNPDTKELREQINDQIQKIESETESESDVTS